MERRITSALFCDILDSSKIPTATAPQGKLPLGSKRYMAACALQPRPNERARCDSHAPTPASSHHLAAFAVVTGTIPRPPKTSFITSKSFTTKKSLPSAYDATFHIPAHTSRTTIPDPSNIWAVRVRIMRSERSYTEGQIKHAGMQMMILIH